ncbi:hypothetical protein [Sphingomonas sp. 28-63-12]|uniref:hypothetical protein n=1 Tax=Sphingomonas sp. 28-63-12 TaxID=1970434 RepID=UPI000BC45D81|nr:MAG: hypothetical protein B7Y47_04720 [Sphingomonas sp. 28-63-12]
MADNEPNTVIVERRSSGTGLIIGVILILLVAVAAYFVVNQTRNDNLRTDAISSAAQDVGDSAKKVGDAADKAVDPNK